MAIDPEKQKALNKVLGDATKKYGDIVLDKNKLAPCDVISTGSLAIDIAIGRGGIPRSRVTEVYGAESSGKTTLALQSIANAQKMPGGLCAFIDAEHALDGEYAKQLGVNLDDLVISQPETGEELMDLTFDLLSSGIFNMIVVDSVAGIIPKACLEGASEDQHMALLARLMSQQLGKISKRAATTNTAMVFLNQMRGTMGATKFAPQSEPMGGRAMRFWSSLRIQTSRTGTNKDGDGDAVSNEVDVKITKNKIAAPFKVAKTCIVFGEGFDVNKELIDYGVALKLIDKAGSWYSLADTKERMGQGTSGVAEYFSANPDVRNSMEAKIRSLYNIA